MDVPAAVTALLNTMVAVDRKNSTGVDITSSSSQMIEVGRVLGSKYSMRWSRSSFFSAEPARMTAVFGVVGTLMIGSFGAFNRGLTAG